MKEEGVSTISGAPGARAARSGAPGSACSQGISVNVSAMFRDPKFFLAFRQQAVPLLRTYPFIRIWQAGCSHGEEAYSLAILLEEEGLYDRSLIYATDINETSAAAGAGRRSIPRTDAAVHAELPPGGRPAAFSEYYTARYDFAILRPALRATSSSRSTTSSRDGPFNEFNVILCRNVMIYFGRPLQERVHALLHASLGTFGILGLGAGETLRFMPLEALYQPLAPDEKLYRRIA